jgi:hypothetical protein
VASLFSVAKAGPRATLSPERGSQASTSNSLHPYVEIRNASEKIRRSYVLLLCSGQYRTGSHRRDTNSVVSDGISQDIETQ